MKPSLPGATTDRRTMLRLLGLGAAATMGGTALTACSKEAGSRGSATGATRSAPCCPPTGPPRSSSRTSPARARSPTAT